MYLVDIQFLSSALEKCQRKTVDRVSCKIEIYIISLKTVQ